MSLKLRYFYWLKVSPISGEIIIISFEYGFFGNLYIHEFQTNVFPVIFHNDIKYENLIPQEIKILV